jgi:hypothetical protein
LRADDKVKLPALPQKPKNAYEEEHTNPIFTASMDLSSRRDDTYRFRGKRGVDTSYTPNLNLTVEHETDKITI